MLKTTEILQKSAASALTVSSLETTRRLVSYVEAASYALLRSRVLSVITVCLIVWLASVWLAATIAQAQESPSNSAGPAMTESAMARQSIEKPESRHLVLSMVDRSDLEPGAARNSATELTNLHPINVQNRGKGFLPSSLRGPEYTSLAALACAPSSSLPYAIPAEGSEQTDTGSSSNDDKFLAYQFGPLNFVVNKLSNSFSVSPAGNSLSKAR
jgi:hypothetical protein